MEVRPSLHARTLSSESVASSCSAQRLILEHILNYPGTYEIPMRTMYALNSAPLQQKLPPVPSTGNSTTAQPLPLSGSTTSSTGDAVKQLTDSLMAQVSQLPNQPTSLPPSFITSFARKCFTAELSDVDFAQALTALDYIRDLESRRRREMQAALERLNVDPKDTENVEHDLRIEYPGALDWYRSIETKERKVDALYSQIYVGLRRWIMINEMSLLPFDKHSCIAMLNTLYPPLQSTQPTSLLTLEVLSRLRADLFKLIGAAQKSGTRSLVNVIKQGRRNGEIDGWLALRELLESYLIMANSIIMECADVLDIKDPARLSIIPSGRRKVDSGIDMPLDSRKSSVCSDDVPPVPMLDVSALNPATRQRDSTGALAEPAHKLQYKSSTTLERIAREFKSMTRPNIEVQEIIAPSPPTVHSSFDAQPSASTRPTTLRKMRSLSALNLKRSTSFYGRNQASSSRPQTPSFDVDKMREEREAYEAQNPTTLDGIPAAPLSARPF